MSKYQKPNPSEPERAHVVNYRKHLVRAVEELMQQLNDVNKNNPNGAIEGDVITLRRRMLQKEECKIGQDNFVVNGYMKVTIHLNSSSQEVQPEGYYPEAKPDDGSYDPTSRH